MADSAVAITAGSGTNVDTRTEGTNGNHRQVVVLGDPSTNAGVAPVDATAGLKVNLGADNDVTVTGTVTANLGATDNAVLDAIAASVAAEQGPVAITAVNSMTSAAVDLAAGTANQSLISAPGANTQIWVYGLMMKTDTNGATVTLQDEDDTDVTGDIQLDAFEGWVLQPCGNFEMPWFKVATNKALEADTTGTGVVDGLITYALVDVS